MSSLCGLTFIAVFFISDMMEIANCRLAILLIRAVFELRHILKVERSSTKVYFSSREVFIDFLHFKLLHEKLLKKHFPNFLIRFEWQQWGNVH